MNSIPRSTFITDNVREKATHIVKTLTTLRTLCFVLFLLSLPASYCYSDSYILALEGGVHNRNEHNKGKAQWLLTDQHDGLSIVDEKLNASVSLKGNYANADVRSIGLKRQVIAAVNVNNNSVDLFKYLDGQLQLLGQHHVQKHALDALCLYHDEQEHFVYAFLVKQYAAIEQVLVYDVKNDQELFLPVRELPVGSEVSACSVHDKSNSLFIAEESLGVWQIPAAPEGESSRKLVDLVKPYGRISGEIESVQVIANSKYGNLFVTVENEEDDKLVYTLLTPAMAEIGKHNKPHSKNIRFKKGKQEAPVALHTMIESYGDSKNMQSSKTKNTVKVSLLYDDKIEIEQFSLKELAVQDSPSKAFPIVEATAETKPVKNFGDAADDPAIWVNPKNIEKSLILGTDKKAGLAVYNLLGELLQFEAVGRLNNVDVRNQVHIGGSVGTIAAASHRDENSIALFQISDYDQPKIRSLGSIATQLDDVYGICMYQDQDQSFVFINDKDGRYAQYQLHIQKESVSAKLVREFRLPDQPEGCVASDVKGTLYMGVEDQGIWQVSADWQSKDAPRKVYGLTDTVHADIEGMALYRFGAKTNDEWLVVSSQGNNSFAVFAPYKDFQYLGSVNVGIGLDEKNGKHIDGVSETDGIDVTSANLGAGYEKGMLVVQDGRNVLPMEPQNFKLVPFAELIKALNLGD